MEAARRPSTLLLIALALGWPRAGMAAGFAIDFESARALGTATAGSAAAADAATIFYNPAGMVFLPRDHAIAGGQVFMFHDRFSDGGSTLLGGALATPGDNGREAIPTKLVPWVFATHMPRPDLALGIGMFAPFGLQTHYGGSFVGRYQNDRSSLRVLDLNPSIAWKPLPWLAVGAGAALEYASVKLSNAIDFGSICLAQVAAQAGAAAAQQACGALSLAPGRSDGQTQVKGDNWSGGWSAGAIGEWGGLRLGISYRSKVEHRFDDATQTFEVPGNARLFLAAGGNPLALTGSNVRTELPLPARTVLGARHRLDSGLELLLDATHTRWGVLRETEIRPDDDATGFRVTIPQGYRDAWRYAVGVNAPARGAWQLRAGFAYDETPIALANAQAALPDRDRRYYTLGATYRFDRHWSADVAYAYVKYLGRVPIDRAGPTGDRLRGEFDVGGGIIALQVRFDS
jgi:long-chain fatty acid transport protein